MRILITGANGFIGQALLEFFSNSDPSIKIRAVARKIVSCPSNIELIVVDDITHNTDWQHVLMGVDVIIHLAARVHVMADQSVDPLSEYRKTNVDGTLNFARQAAQQGVKRFIFMSTIKVNGEFTENGQAFTEEWEPNPLDPYAVSKFEAEEGLKAICALNAMQYVIIRPPLIYGPGVKANFAKLMKLVSLRLPLPLGGVRNQRSMLALGNLVDFIYTAINHPRAGNQLFLLADNLGISTPNLLSKLGVEMHKPILLISLRPEFLLWLGKLMGVHTIIQRLIESLQIDSSKARAMLDWLPPFSVDQSLQETVDDFILSKQKMVN